MFKNIYFPVISFILIAGAVFVSFYYEMPHYQNDITNAKKAFSTDRALLHLKEIAQKPHYIGADDHAIVKQYLYDALQNMGLNPEIQEQEVFNAKWDVAAKTYNVIAKISGTNSKGEALLLLTHYDSAPHTESLGASDDGNGLVAILESIRAYITTGIKPKNDIIILFSDAEEIGLLGAKAFVEHHPWAKKVGLVLNMEARGSGGPGYMLLETNDGNANFIKTFAEAKLSHPVSNSLMYSIYKMLPNDTDLTVFRENGNIDGFNFAFIDDHFDYHTAQDSYERIDLNSLKHQGETLYKLLQYYATADLSQLKGSQDLVYFNFPLVGMIYYPFSWVQPLVWITLLGFLVLVGLGFQKKRIILKESFKSFIPLLTSLILAFLIGFLGWKFILWLAPQYKEILHGFPYNGKMLLIGFIALTIAVFLKTYSTHFKKKTLPDLLFAPMVIWWLINAVVAIKLKGAGFLIVPLLQLLITYAILIFSSKIRAGSLLIFTLLSLPILMLFSPLIAMFPVGLGMKNVLISTVFLVLILTTLISTFDFYKNHKPLINLFLLISILSFTSAYISSGFNKEQRKPNSILFLQDVDKKEAYWASYDQEPDDFTIQFLGGKPEKGDFATAFSSKYKTKLNLYTKTLTRDITPSLVELTLNDSLNPNQSVWNYTITSQRKSNILILNVLTPFDFYAMKINGVPYDKKLNSGETVYHAATTLLTYYLAQGVNKLHVEITTLKGVKPQLELYDISLDLMRNKAFDIHPRTNDMMPKPFVINNAVVLKKKV